MHQVFFKIERQITSFKRTLTVTQQKKLKAYNLYPRLAPMQFIPRRNGAYDLLNSHLHLFKPLLGLIQQLKKLMTQNNA